MVVLTLAILASTLAHDHFANAKTGPSLRHSLSAGINGHFLEVAPRELLRVTEFCKADAGGAGLASPNTPDVTGTLPCGGFQGEILLIRLTHGGLALPTWLYGHEPANLFAGQIGKYFSNAVREDTILRLSRGGIVFAPGWAGTVQEVFQAATKSVSPSTTSPRASGRTPRSSRSSHSR